MLTDGQSKSIWYDTGQAPREAALNQDLQTDVCIVGAGISGLTTAYKLAQAGRRVVVLDDKEVAGGQTGRSTAQMSTACDDRYREMEKLHGAEGARLIAESFRAAIDELERISQAENINCDFERVDGYLFLPSDQGGEEVLDEELAASHRAGLSTLR